MLENRYLSRLVKTYSEVILDERKIDEIAEEVATMTPEELGIDEVDLNKAAAVIVKANEKASIDTDSMSAEELIYEALTLLGRVRGVSNTMDEIENEKAAAIMGIKLENSALNQSRYRKDYNRRNMSFYSKNNLSKVRTALLMGIALLNVKLSGLLNAADVVTYIANNPTAVEKVIRKELDTDTLRKEGVVIRYAQVPSPYRPAIDRIKSRLSNKLPEIYSRFREAGALTPLPENDSLDIKTRLSLRIYMGAKTLYNKFSKRGAPVSFDEILASDEKTEIATQYVVFAAIAYNVLDRLDYASLGVRNQQITELVNDLHAGEYDVKFKDDANVVIQSFGRNMIIEMLNSDIGFEIRLHEIKVLGFGEVSGEIKDKLTKDKAAIALVKGTPLYDIYVVLPVLVTHDSMSPVHEVVFRIRCDLSVYGTQQSSVSQANANTNSSPFRRKRARPFSRKKKYDWM
jgi:hypothetical protein